MPHHTTEHSAEERLSRLFPPVEESAAIVVACRRGHYSAGMIARAVEDCSAPLLNLNVTADGGADEIVVELRVAVLNAEPVVRSLERYGLRVVAVEAAATEPDLDSVRSRVNELIHYLEI